MTCAARGHFDQWLSGERVAKHTSCKSAARRDKCRVWDVANKRKTPLPGAKVEHTVYLYMTEDKIYVPLKRIYLSLQHLQLSREVDKFNQNSNDSIKHITRFRSTLSSSSTSNLLKRDQPPAAVSLFVSA